MPYVYLKFEVYGKPCKDCKKATECDHNSISCKKEDEVIHMFSRKIPIGFAEYCPVKIGVSSRHDITIIYIHQP